MCVAYFSLCSFQFDVMTGLNFYPINMGGKDASVRVHLNSSTIPCYCLTIFQHVHHLTCFLSRYEKFSGDAPLLDAKIKDFEKRHEEVYTQRDMCCFVCLSRNFRRKIESRKHSRG
jgi:hypothetical protein